MLEILTVAGRALGLLAAGLVELLPLDLLDGADEDLLEPDDAPPPDGATTPPAPLGAVDASAD